MMFDTDVVIWVSRGNLRAARIIDSVTDRALSVVSFEELAQNGRATRGRCGRVSKMFGAAIGGLCAL